MTYDVGIVLWNSVEDKIVFLEVMLKLNYLELMMLMKTEKL